MPNLLIIIISVILAIAILYILIQHISIKLFGGKRTTYKVEDPRIMEFIDIASQMFGDDLESTFSYETTYMDVISAIESLKPPEGFSDYDSVFEMTRLGLISRMEKWGDIRALLSYFDPVDLIEALTYYIYVKKHDINNIEYIGRGAEHEVFVLSEGTGENVEKKVLKIYKRDVRRNEWMSIIERVLKSKLPCMPYVYCSSCDIPHNKDPNVRTSLWMIMKYYDCLNRDNVIQVIGLGNCYLSMVKLALALYRKGLVFADWKVDNMLLEDKQRCVSGELMFLPIIDSKPLPYLSSQFEKLIGRYTEPIYDEKTRESFHHLKDEITSLDLMMYIIKESLVETYTGANYGSITTPDEINGIAMNASHLPSILKGFCELVQLPSIETNYKPIDIEKIEELLKGFDNPENNNQK